MGTGGRASRAKSSKEGDRSTVDWWARLGRARASRAKSLGEGDGAQWGKRKKRGKKGKKGKKGKNQPKGKGVAGTGDGSTVDRWARLGRARFARSTVDRWAHLGRASTSRAKSL